MKRLTFAVQFKAVDGEPGVLEGYASTFGNVDQGGDVVMPGAFTKTINERVATGRVKLLSGHSWDPNDVLGTVREAREDAKGLWFKAEMSQASDVANIRQKLIEGHLDRLSIGYSAIKWSYEKDDNEDSIRKLEEIRLYEVSVVPFPMNEEAAVTNVKGEFYDLPLAPMETEWDAEAALERVREFTQAKESPNYRYEKAFLSVNGEKAHTLDGYSELIADVIGNRMVVIPAAIIDAAKGDDAKNHKPVIDRYYNKMRREFNRPDLLPPWKCAERKDSAEPVTEPLTETNLQMARIAQLETQFLGGF